MKKYERMILRGFVYILSIALYLQPLTTSTQYISREKLIKNPDAVLDEAWLVRGEKQNNDILVDPNQRSSLHDVFQNDYWGR